MTAYELWWDYGWPLLIMIGQSLLLAVGLLLVIAFLLLMDRKVWAAVQMRRGPNVVGPFGLFQSFADLLKFVLKEPVIPAGSDRVLFLLAPLATSVLAIAVWAVIPLNENSWGRWVIADLNVGILYILAISSLGVYGIVIGGWASNSKYAFMGSLRSAAQMISYEVAMGLALVAVFLYAGSMSTSEIVEAQDDLWFGLILVPSFVIYLIAMVGETNRAPFDLPEAEGELVGGFHTEYSSLKFALFFLAEYINMATVSALAATLFLGGWHAPFWIDEVWAGANEGYWPALWFFGKVFFFVFIIIWLRGSLPR